MRETTRNSRSRFLGALLAVLRCTDAQMICQGCRPIEYQLSPSIGLDFTMSYGIAAVQFSNGTYLNVAKIDGPRAYRDAMKQFAESVQDEQRGKPPIIPHSSFDPEGSAFVYDPRWPDAYDLSAVQKAIKAAMKPLGKFLAAPGAKSQETLPKSDKWTEPLRQMVTALTERVAESVPEAEKFVLFTSPDSLRVNKSFFPRLRLAIRLAGFEEWGNRNAASSRVAVHHLGFGQFSEDTKFSYGKKSFKALVITLTDTAMTLAEVQTEDGNLYNLPKSAAFVKPPMKHTSQQFTQNVRMALQQFLRGEKDGKEHLDLDYDEIYLLGDGADQQELKDGLGLVFDNKIKDPSGKSKVRTLEPDDELYAAARGAARIAREGLETAFNKCQTNDWCPQLTPVQTVDPSLETDVSHSEL